MTVSVVDTDYLVEMRADLVGVVAAQGIAYHDTEPRALGETPAAWFGRPAVYYAGAEIVVDWPLSFAGSSADPENTTATFDLELWPLIMAFGAGRKAMVDGQRSVRFVRADPTRQTIGEHEFPVYAIAIQTTVPIGIC